MEEPCALMQKSLSLYEALEQNNGILPNWGKGQAVAMTKKCSGNN